MAQLFPRRSNALARMVLVVGGVSIVAVGLALNHLQRAPWMTRQAERTVQPVAFSHKHHVEAVGLQCQYCHTSVERSSYAGIPPTKICMNCHAQIWTNAQLLEPVRQSWAKGESIQWKRVNDLPDYVYFSHEIHVAKGVGCATCHGAVNQMPITYQATSLQMEWCLSCHRNPAANLRPASEVYNMAWQEPSVQHPVWCAVNGKMTGPTAENVDCRTKDPDADLMMINRLETPTAPDMDASRPAQDYKKFTTQQAMGKFLVESYKVRTVAELTSCEVCHR